MRLWVWGDRDKLEETRERRIDSAVRETLRKQEFSRYARLCIDEPDPSRRKEIVEEWRQRVSNSTTARNHRG